MIPFYPHPLPQVDTSQMQEVDRLMTDVYQIQLIQMMENAGRHLAELARSRFLKSDTYGKRVLVLAGAGGNGGGALVAARFLANAGAKVTVVLSDKAEKLSPIPAHQLRILSQMELSIFHDGQLDMAERSHLVIDGMIGYGLKAEPKGRVAELVHWANQSKFPILALDVPTGFDSRSAKVMTPCIQASATMTLALPKKGLLKPELNLYVGDLYLANISVPKRLYSEPSLKLKVPDIFRHSDIVQLT